MKTEDLVYDIIEIKSLLEDDSPIDQLWLLNKINMYRSVFIFQDYLVNHVVRPSWLQRFYKTAVAKVTAADDPSIILSSVMIGKAVIPTVIALPEDLGMYRISGSSGIIQYQPIDFNTLMMKLDVKEERMGKYGYCSRMGNDLYLHPLCAEIQGIVIAADPFEIKVVSSGVFRDRLVTDMYPLDADLAQRVILEILTKDLAINEQSITDTVNDSQSQLRILKGGTNQPAANNQ